MMGKYLKFNEQQRIMFWLIVIAGIGFIGLCPLFFFYQMKGYSYPLGWLLGSIAEIIGFWTIMKMGDYLLPKSGDVKDRGNVVPLIVLRFLSYVIVLVISAICTFKSIWFGGFDAFNFWTVFAAIVPAQIAPLFRSSRRRVG